MELRDAVSARINGQTVLQYKYRPDRTGFFVRALDCERHHPYKRIQSYATDGIIAEEKLHLKDKIPRVLLRIDRGTYFVLWNHSGDGSVLLYTNSDTSHDALLGHLQEHISDHRLQPCPYNPP